MTPPRIAGLREIADRYDAFLVDQFGVLHDGRAAFAGARACLEALRARGARIGVVSNSGKRSGPNAARLAELGFARELFDAVTTSGEVCHDLIARKLAAGEIAPGAAIHVVARDTDRSVIAGLDVTETSDPAAADLALIAGAAPERMSLDAYAASLAPLASRGAPCICANPDLRMYVAGGVSFGAGAIALRYAEAGGAVRWIGKPHREIFAHALAALGNPAPSRTLMIGDSVGHDIEGARASGCDWALVLGGVYAGETPADLPETGGVIIDALAW